MSSELLDQGTTNNKPAEPLDGAGRILTMGIISIVLFSGIIGIILAVITLNRAKMARELYREYPYSYTESSYKKVNAGRICAIVSLSLLVGLILILMVVSSM